MADVGRPTKYESSMCYQVIEHMSKGASKCEVAAELGVTEGTLYNWQNSNDEFLEAIKIGEEKSKAWWLKQGRINLENKDFSAALWYMNLKNRHGWRDKPADEATPIKDMALAIIEAQQAIKASESGDT